mgnify:CR=1 FL=1
MRIVNAPPPNYIAISDRFKLAKLKDFNPVFAYGDIIYNPTGDPISEDLMIHEEVHSRQQMEIGVEEWWNLYLESDSFRLEQEIEAYSAQYQYICQHGNREMRRKELDRLASNLASGLYGSIIKKKDALELIQA